MANTLFDNGRDKFLNAATNYGSDTIKVAALNIASYGLVITACTTATPPVCTTATHSYTTGDNVMIWGALVETVINGVFKITVVSATTFSLQDINTGANIVGSGTYTASSARVINITAQQNLSDVTTQGATVVATGVALATKTSTGGVANAASLTFPTVSGSAIGALLIYKDTGTGSTSTLIGYIDTGTGLPVTPNGGDITVNWSTGNNKIFKL